MRATIFAVIVAASVPAAAAPASRVLADGLAAYAAGRFPEARRDFQQLADDDSAIGETMLGTIYAHGQGVARDLAAAAGYYCRAAHRGYAPAQLAFAKVLVRGQGVAVDRKAAWLWLRLAQQRGDVRVVAAARAEAATLVATGTPIPADEVADWRPWPSGED